MTITTTVTWADLLNSTTDELPTLREAYDELETLVTEEYGEDALDRTLPQDPELLEDDERNLWVYRTQMDQYDEAAKSIQQREHVLQRLQEEYGDEPFEIKMLSGDETVEIEIELRMLAEQRDTSVEKIQTKRNTLVADAATVDAPEGIPTEDGSPVPSDAPNALTLALWEQINQFNNSGATDFQAPGFGDDSPDPTATAEQSATPTVSESPTDASE